MKQSYEQLGTNIACYRRRAGLTQDMLSIQMGVSMQAVSKWERGISFPDVSLLLHIEEVPWDNDDEYRLALFHGKVLLSRQTHVCRRGGDLIAHIRIPEGGEGEEG